MKVIYAPQALRDVDDILAYIQKRSPGGARNVSVAIERAVEACALNPRTGARTDEPEVYRRPLNKYRYTIFTGYLPTSMLSNSCAWFTAPASRISAGCRGTIEVGRGGELYLNPSKTEGSQSTSCGKAATMARHITCTVMNGTTPRNMSWMVISGGAMPLR